MNVETSNNSNGAWMPTIFGIKKNECRDDMINCLRRLDIDARPTFWPLSGLGMFRHLNANNPKSEFFQNRSVNLPSFHEIKPEDQVKVADVLTKFFQIEPLKISYICPCASVFLCLLNSLLIRIVIRIQATVGFRRLAS